MQTTHVFIVGTTTFKYHLEYQFAGTGAKDYKIDFNAGPTSSLNATIERNLVGMMSDSQRVRVGDYVILSVPWEPWFSVGSFMRGKYLKTWGRHPEHVNFWNKREFTRLISQHFQVVKATHSFPWLIAVLKKR